MRKNFLTSQDSQKVQDVKQPQALASSPLGHPASPTPVSELHTVLGVPRILLVQELSQHRVRAQSTELSSVHPGLLKAGALGLL